MKTELFISWRYLVTKRKEKFIFLISTISVLGVAIGVAALIVVIAVMTGFDKDLRDKIVGNYSHIVVSKYDGITPLEYEDIAKKISTRPHVTGVSPYVQGQVLVKDDTHFFAVGVRGVDPATESKVSRFASYLVAGGFGDLDETGIIIGKELASYMGVTLNSSLEVISPLGKNYKLRVAGIFNSGMYDYDLNLVFVNLKTSQDILGLKDKISSVAIKLDDLYLADSLTREFSGILGFGYSLKSWMQVNENFFAALNLEKLAMFVILALIILVATFNIASTLIVMVVDKTKDIGILRSLGMTAGQIRTIFTFEGVIIGALGTLLGALGGVGLCLLLKKYQFIKLPQNIYYIDHLPVVIDKADVFWIVSSAFLITLVSTIYPAAKAAGLKPVEALRYE